MGNFSYQGGDGGSYGDAAGLTQGPHGAYLLQWDPLVHRLLDQGLQKPGVRVQGHIDLAGPAAVQGTICSMLSKK